MSAFDVIDVTDASKVMKNWEPNECGRRRTIKDMSVMQWLYTIIPVLAPTIGVRTSVGHGKEASLRVLGGEVLIREFGTVNRLP